MKPLLAVLLVSAAGLLAYSGARYANLPYAFGALALRESLHATASPLQRGMAQPQGASHAASSAASNASALGAAHGAPAHAPQRAAMHATSTPAGRPSDAPKEVPRPEGSPPPQRKSPWGEGNALADQSPRERLARLRAPLSPEAQNDPFSVQSWLPPPPPPPPVAVAKVPEAPPVAPPLRFSYVGTLNRDQGKTQVFLANGDQLLIVSPGDVIDGRYRLESIAATGAVFTYLPLNERQELTIEGRGN
jgi:hypothetical protein